MAHCKYQSTSLYSAYMMANTIFRIRVTNYDIMREITGAVQHSLSTHRKI